MTRLRRLLSCFGPQAHEGPEPASADDNATVSKRVGPAGLASASTDRTCPQSISSVASTRLSEQTERPIQQQQESSVASCEPPAPSQKSKVLSHHGRVSVQSMADGFMDAGPRVLDSRTLGCILGGPVFSPFQQSAAVPFTAPEDAIAIISDCIGGTGCSLNLMTGTDTFGSSTDRPFSLGSPDVSNHGVRMQQQLQALSPNLPSTNAAVRRLLGAYPASANQQQPLQPQPQPQHDTTHREMSSFSAATAGLRPSSPLHGISLLSLPGLLGAAPARSHAFDSSSRQVSSVAACSTSIYASGSTTATTATCSSGGGTFSSFAKVSGCCAADAYEAAVSCSGGTTAASVGTAVAGRFVSSAGGGGASSSTAWPPFTAGATGTAAIARGSASFRISSITGAELPRPPPVRTAFTAMSQQQQQPAAAEFQSSHQFSHFHHDQMQCGLLALPAMPRAGGPSRGALYAPASAAPPPRPQYEEQPLLAPPQQPSPPPPHHDDEPHPADNLLRSTDLEACWAQLRDLSFIGSGAVGNVYSGTWCGVPVAVKFMLSGDVGQLHRQQREAALSRLASHPHLVQTYAVAAAQLTPAHFRAGFCCSSPRRIASCLSNTDLLGTCTAVGTAADLYDTCALSRSQSTEFAVANGRPSYTTLAGRTPPTAIHLATGFGCSAVMTGNAAPVAGTWDHRASADCCLQIITTDTVFDSAAAPAAVAGKQGKQPPPQQPLSFKQQVRSRMSGTVGGAPPSSSLMSIHVMDAAVADAAAASAVFAQKEAHMSMEQLLARGSVLPVPPMPPLQTGTAVRQLGATASGGSARLPKGTLAWRSPPDHRRSRVQMTGGGDAPCTPTTPTFPCLAALDSSISTVDVDASMLEVEGKADSFEMSGVEGHGCGLMLFQMADVLTHIGARPGQWLTVVIMEEMDRGSLHHCIHSGVFHPDSTVLEKRHRVRGMVRTLVEVAQGMAHLHSSGLVHGDLKPANVLLKTTVRDLRGFTAKVSDFGVTRSVTNGVSAVSNSDWGTVIYTAPEVFTGKSGLPSDVFSFGVLVWHLATGQLPHEDINPFAVMLAVSRDELELEWPERVPKPLRKLGKLCMQHDPALRPTFPDIVRALLRLEARMRKVSATASSMSSAASAAVAAAMHFGMRSLGGGATAGASAGATVSGGGGDGGGAPGGGVPMYPSTPTAAVLAKGRCSG